jgi:hypothetical protein
MIEAILIFVMTSAILFGLVFFIKMRRQIPIVNKDLKLNVIEIKDSVNPKIEEALEKGSEERHENLLKYSKLVQAEKERLLKDDYIYDKIKNAVSENRFHFVMSTNNNEITRDAINLIPGMKAFIDKFSKLTVTFPNRE